MVEWWQAVLIGLAPSLVTAVVALVIQRQQQKHGLQAQTLQIDADRQARREEAARQHLREQARPLYDFLAVVERDQGRRLLRGMLQGEGTRARAWGDEHPDPSLACRRSVL